MTCNCVAVVTPNYDEVITVSEKHKNGGFLLLDAANAFSWAFGYQRVIVLPDDEMTEARPSTCPQQQEYRHKSTEVFLERIHHDSGEVVRPSIKNVSNRKFTINLKIPAVREEILKRVHRGGENSSMSEAALTSLNLPGTTSTGVDMRKNSSGKGHLYRNDSESKTQLSPIKPSQLIFLQTTPELVKKSTYQSMGDHSRALNNIGLLPTVATPTAKFPYTHRPGHLRRRLERLILNSRDPDLLSVRKNASGVFSRRLLSPRRSGYSLLEEGSPPLEESSSLLTTHSDVISSSESADPVVGLQNQGNLCYLNSLLQCLARCGAAEALKHAKSPTAKAMWRSLNLLSKGRSVNTKELAITMDLPNQQQDAYEIFGQVTESLRKENSLLPHEWFQMTAIKRCSKCRAICAFPAVDSIYVDAAARDVPKLLNTAVSISLQELLASNIQRCGSCAHRGTIVVSDVVFPDRLVIGINRLFHNSAGNTMLSTHEFGFSGDDFSVHVQCGRESMVYKLVGTICHENATLREKEGGWGHYVSYVRQKSTNTWSRIDDNKVKQVRSDEAISGNVVLYFFTKH